MNRITLIKEIYYEKIIEFYFIDFRIRLWAIQDVTINWNIETIRQELYNFTANNDYTLNIIAKFIINNYEINAVEVLDHNQQGVVLYADWP